MATHAGSAACDTRDWLHDSDAHCWSCGAERGNEIFCPRCRAILPFPERADYFQVLGLPRSPVVDAALLQRRYYELHRKLHPDLFQTGAPEARQASLRNTATVNQAFRTLRDPEDRGLYWLTLQGEALGSNNNRVPAHLAALVFEVQEKLAEMRSGDPSGRDEMLRIRADLQQQREALLQRLEANFSRWSAANEGDADLTRELKDVLSQLAYLNTLIRDVDGGLEQ
jgi:molecular chaperone HscB